MDDTDRHGQKQTYSKDISGIAVIARHRRQRAPSEEVRNEERLRSFIAPQPFG